METRPLHSIRFPRAVHLLFLALAFVLPACGGGGSAGPAAPPDETIGRVVQTSLRAESNRFVYPIQVFLPQSYDAGTGLLPVIYATEGDAPYGAVNPVFGNQPKSRFDTFKEAMQRRGTQAILVGIGGTERRGTDFLLPGAADYLKFIAQELAPAIERQYRADPRRRALSGLSHGGYFVVAALVLEGQAGLLSFSHYLSTEPSYGGHASVPDFLAFERQLEAGKPLATTLLLSGARTGNASVVGAPLYAQIAARNHPGLVLLKSDYETTHVGADLPAFEEALTRFFP